MRVPLTSEMYGSDGKLSREWFSFFSDLAKAVEEDAARAFDDFTSVADPANLARRDTKNTFLLGQTFSSSVEVTNGPFAVGAPVNLAGDVSQFTGNVTWQLGTYTLSGTFNFTGVSQFTGGTNVIGNFGATGWINTGGGFRFNGVQVVGAQLAAVATPTVTTGSAGATYTATEQSLINALVASVASLKTAVDLLRARLSTHGLTL